jgi:hypothetical protein
MEYLLLNEIRDKSAEIKKALEALSATKAIVGKPNAKQWLFFRACVELLFSPETVTGFEKLQPIQAAQFKFEVEDKLNRFYLHPGKPLDFVFSLAHKSKLSGYGIENDSAYPALADYCVLIRDLSIENDRDKINDHVNLSLYLERVVTEGIEAEFRAYQALPDIRTEELTRWFCADSPALKEILNLLNRHKKKRWFINNPMNPSTKRLLNISVKSVMAEEAIVTTTEYWYLRWWDEKEDSYVYAYRETNNQSYILKPESGDWKVHMNLRPQPRTSTPHRWNRRQGKNGN